MANLDPTVTIDKSGTVSINGEPTILAEIGQPVAIQRRSIDPGSDDLTATWDWDDGRPRGRRRCRSSTAPDPDPFPSPSVQPATSTSSPPTPTSAPA